MLGGNSGTIPADIITESEIRYTSLSNMNFSFNTVSATAMCTRLLFVLHDGLWTQHPTFPYTSATFNHNFPIPFSDVPGCRGLLYLSCDGRPKGILGIVEKNARHPQLYINDSELTTGVRRLRWAYQFRENSWMVSPGRRTIFIRHPQLPVDDGCTTGCRCMHGFSKLIESRTSCRL